MLASPPAGWEKGIDWRKLAVVCKRQPIANFRQPLPKKLYVLNEGIK
jgi:hypothetical protein